MAEYEFVPIFYTTRYAVDVDETIIGKFAELLQNSYGMIVFERRKAVVIRTVMSRDCSQYHKIHDYRWYDDTFVEESSSLRACCVARRSV